MNQLRSFVIALNCFVAFASPALARGSGTWSYFVTSEGQLAASLGETSNDLLDPMAGVQFRYHDGRVTAATFAKPDRVLWSVGAGQQLHAHKPNFRLLPEILVVIGDNTITGIDRASGKVLYTTDADSFTRETGDLFLLRALEDAPPMAKTLLLIDNTAQEKQHHRGMKFPNVPARLARFDLLTGKFEWKTNIVTAAGENIVPVDIDPRGIVGGITPYGNADFVFDPTTGRALAKLPEQALPPKVDAHPRPRRLQFYDSNIEYLDDAGKVVWSRKEPGLKGDPILSKERIVLPIAVDQRTAVLVELDCQDGSQRWRLELPKGDLADRITVQIQPAKGGYIVQVHWIVLD